MRMLGLPSKNLTYIPSLFVETHKEEEVHLNDYENITDARKRIGHFIGYVYHQKRPHAALGNHLTPLEFQRKNLPYL